MVDYQRSFERRIVQSSSSSDQTFQQQLGDNTGLSIGISVQRDTMADELELHVNYPLVYTNAILTKRGDQWRIVERGNRNNSASTPRLDQAFNSAWPAWLIRSRG